MKVAIGVDWNPTGSDSIFAELRVADTVNHEELDDAIPTNQWFAMITTPAADESLLKNQVQDVQLVIVGGKPLYGSRAAMTKLRPTGCEALTVHGSPKRICVADPTARVTKSSETLAQLRQILLSRYPALAPLAP